MSVFIIAEVGSNFHDFRDLKTSIEIAHRCGADAVKFQCFSEASLYGYGSSRPRLAHAWLPKLADHCKAVGIEFMCTAFDVETLSYVDKYVRRHKLASSEMRHTGLIEAIKRSKKPALVSVGGHSFDRIERTVKDLDKHDFTLLYCSNAYPSRLHDLEVIDDLRSRFGCDVGFSDHSIDIYSATSAVRHYRAAVVEKHVDFINAGSADSGHSIDERMFSVLVAKLRQDHKHIHPALDEHEAVKLHNRRLVATQNLNTGDALQFGRNFGVYRCREKTGDYLDPSMADKVNGTRVAQPLRQGQAIGASHFR